MVKMLPGIHSFSLKFIILGLHLLWFFFVFTMIIISNHPKNDSVVPFALKSERSWPKGLRELGSENVNSGSKDTEFVPPRGDSRLGEMGRPVILGELTEEQQKLVETAKIQYGFNQYVSDKISPTRSLPDYRDNWCKVSGRYNPKTQTSIIITFYNEAWTTFIRAIHSIINRTPMSLVKEIILVDDNSDLNHLKTQLETYLKPYRKIKIIRSKERLGLIRARLWAVSQASASILTFLDAHVEVTTGWLEPLIDRIENNSTAIVCPIVDRIDYNTWEYESYSSTAPNLGGFDWNLMYTWKTISPRERAMVKHPAEPMPSPTMIGGIFSVRKDWFKRLGQYDPEYNIWGAENMELSFKAWMCGGSVEYVSCSRVGHIYRERQTYRSTSHDNFLNRNLVRLAKVWMDEYAHYFYQRIGYNLGSFGDITERKLLRSRLHCKSFDWYMTHINQDMFNPKYNAIAAGEIRNQALNGKWCLDSAYGYTKLPVILWKCHGQGSNQHFWYTKTGEIRREDTCLDYFGNNVTMLACHGARGNQEFIFNSTSGVVYHESSNKCLTMVDKEISIGSATSLNVTMEKCEKKDTQRWKFQNYQPMSLAIIK